MTFFGAALLTAITSAVLAVGAILTAVFAVLAFRGQSRQLDLQRQQLDDQRNASAKQAEVLELQATALNESLREAQERRHAQEAMVHAWQTTEDGPEPAEIFAHVQNISQQPLYDVVLQWWPEPSPPWDEEEECAKVKTASKLMPGEILDDRSDDLGPYACWGVIFRDSARVQWQANQFGPPVKVAEK